MAVFRLDAMTWAPIQFKSVRELANRVLAMSLDTHERGGGAGWVWRGEPEIYPNGIVPGIDRPIRQMPFLSAVEYDLRLRQEIDWYGTWWARMLPLMLPRDLLSPIRNDGVPELQWLNFAAHHGCRSRIVDWSESPWVALYFACSKAFHKPGRVWCFDAKVLADRVGAKWDEWQVPLVPGGGRDIAKAAFAPTRHRWVVTQYNNRAPLRMSSQLGLFTVASRLGETHDRLLDELLPDSAKFVITIPAGTVQDGGWKEGLLSFLRSMGIHHESLLYPMLDQVSGTIEPE
jgi:hypothetical protein